MKRVEPVPDWPELWKSLHENDRQFVWDRCARRGPLIGYHGRLQLVLDLFERHAPRGARVLDVAAAQGNFTLALAERGYDVTWNDIRADLAGYVQLKHEAGQIDYVGGDVFGAAFPEPFDAVLIGEIIEHVAHPDQFLGRIAQLVRPGGVVVMTTPNGAFFRNTLPRWSDHPDPSVFESEQFQPDGDGHIFLLWPDEVAALGEGGALTLEQLTLFNNFATIGCYRTDMLMALLPEGVVLSLDRLSQRLAPSWLARRAMFHLAAVFRRPAG